MRNFSRSWAAYLLLFVLMVAFAIWGINDVFSGAGAQNIAQVGGRAVTPANLARELELTLRGERQNNNVNMTQQEAVDQGLHLRLLEGIIARHAMTNYAEKLNVSVSNTQVAATIRDIPSVTNPITGAFDEAAYNNFLSQLRYGRGEFEEDIRTEVVL
jgi:peptidyl-prolyl cis-trans isomerase D